MKFNLEPDKVISLSSRMHNGDSVLQLQRLRDRTRELEKVRTETHEFLENKETDIRLFLENKETETRLFLVNKDRQIEKILEYLYDLEAEMETKKKTTDEQDIERLFDDDDMFSFNEDEKQDEIVENEMENTFEDKTKETYFDEATDYFVDETKETYYDEATDSFKDETKETYYDEGTDSFKDETKETNGKRTHLKGSLIMIGKELQQDVERIAKNKDFFVHKTESFKIIFKKENVLISWFFTKGTVMIQGKGVNVQSFKKCTINQFINILENPKDPKTDQEENNSKSPEIKMPFQESIIKESFKASDEKMPFRKSYAAEKFEDQHINGIHHGEKPVNSKAAFDKEGYLLLRPSGKPDTTPNGTRQGQKLFMTKNKVAYSNTGKKRFGETGEAHFVIAGQHLAEDRQVVPEHLSGPAWVRDDQRVEINHEVFSQCFSQATQYMD